MMYSFKSNSPKMSCGASAYMAEASFSMHTPCTDIALLADAMIMASIIISIISIISIFVFVLVADISLLVLIPAILLAVLLIREIEYGLRKQAYV